MIELGDIIEGFSLIEAEKSPDGPDGPSEKVQTVEAFLESTAVHLTEWCNMIRIKAISIPAYEA